MAPGDRAAERAALADEVRLAHELVERPRAHAGGERLALGRGLEQGFGAGAGDGAPGRHGPMVARAGRQPIGNTFAMSIRYQRPNRIASIRLPIRTICLTSRATYAYSSSALIASDPPPP